MKAEMYYRETWPKELRIQIQNEDELRFLSLLFAYSPRGVLKKYTANELSDFGLSADWKKKFISEYGKYHEDQSYQTGEISTVIEEEFYNMAGLEIASSIEIK